MASQTSIESPLLNQYQSKIMFVSNRALKLLAFLSTFATNAILTTSAADVNVATYEHDQSTTDGIDLIEIKNGLRDSKLHLGNRRELQTAKGYSFYVDMYIEVDFDLCARHGEACTNGVGPKTLNYINVLFAGANTVYEVSSVGIFACEMDVRCAIIFANLSSCGMLPRSQFNRRKSIPT